MRKKPEIDAKKVIYEGLISQVNKKGIADISTAHLAKDIGLAESTIFYYYKNVRNLIDECAMRYDRELMEYSKKNINEGQSMSELWDILFDYVLKNPNGANFYFDYVNYYGFDPTENNARGEEFIKVARTLFKGKEFLDDHNVLILWDYITTQLFYYCNKMTKGYMELNEKNKVFIKQIVFLVYDNIKQL